MTKMHHSLKDLNVTKQAKEEVRCVMALPWKVNFKKSLYMMKMCDVVREFEMHNEWVLIY
jgi:hypothetical protein